MSQNTIKPTGLSYLGDEGTTSVYVFQIESIPVMHVLLDNAVEVEQDGVTAPEGATLHRVYVATTDRKVTLETKGVGARVAHLDDDGVSAPHIDGMTVLQYLAPRVPYWMARLLQARQEV